MKTPSTLTQKECSKCGKEKPIGCFHAQSNRPDGRHSQCKVCRSVVTNEYSRSERGKETQKAYRMSPEVRERYKEERRQRRRDPRWQGYTERYNKLPRSKVLKSIAAYRYFLKSSVPHRRPETAEARLKSLLAELARMDGEFELPERLSTPKASARGRCSPPRPETDRAEYGSRSAGRGVYQTATGKFAAKIRMAADRVVNAGTFATAEEARDAVNRLAERLLGIKDYASGTRRKGRTDQPPQRTATL